MLTAAGKIKPREIADELKSSFLDYAMSVIVSRALPDVRDGLKPVHRRILYAMYDQGMLPNKRYEKCASTVGEVLKKYHPHGDSAVYDTLVRMAQDFSLRYPLIDGQGNFGSIDGDSAAAYRYTEARLGTLAMELLRDIDEETVDFVPNFSETTEEPAVMPSRFPNLMVNGSGGIAVGMATNIPPHNLSEVIDGCVHLIDNPEAGSQDLMAHIKAPDFPTGGIIMGHDGIQQAYHTGRGILKVRGKARIEEAQNGRMRIIVTEIPYQVNKARLAEKIADLVKEGKLKEVADLRDESDRSGMRLVVELKRDSIPKVALNKLYKHTQLESAFGIIMLALVDGVPKTLSLRDMLHHYLEHQKDVVVRRTQFRLAKAKARAHILEGLLIALDHIDQVIALIRGSRTVDDARTGLIEKFSLSEIQANAILEMRLQRLTALESDKVKEEHAGLIEKISVLEGILAEEIKVWTIIKEELLEIKKKFGDERRTAVTAAVGDLDIEDLIPEEDMVVTITHAGYVKRVPVDTYRQQRRGGRGITAQSLKDGDFMEHLFISSTHHFVLFFSNKGKVYKLKVHELPLAGRQAKGTAIVNLLPLEGGEKIAAVIATKDFHEDAFLAMATRSGMVKKTPFSAYNVSRRDGIIAINLKDGDELISVRKTTGEDELVMVSRAGMAIRFKESDARPLGRASQGVNGMRLAGGDAILDMDVVSLDSDLLVVTENGYGKRTAITKYPLQRRGGKGVITIKHEIARGKLVGAGVVKMVHETMLVSDAGVIIRVPVEGIRQTGRSCMGVRIMRLGAGDKVSTFARVPAGTAAGGEVGLDQDDLDDEGEDQSLEQEALFTEGDALPSD